MNITFPILEKKIRELVADNPDYVYPAKNELCVYNAGQDLPPCIFGRAFIELGFPLPSYYEGSSISGILRDLKIEHSRGDLVWADTLQGNQDRGRPWGLCLTIADEQRKAFEE